MSTLEERWLAHIRLQHPTLDESSALRVAREAAKTLREPPRTVEPFDVRKQAEEAFDLSYLDEFRLWLAWGVVKKKGIPKMKTWCLELWNDPAKFVGAIRFLLVSLSGLILSGQLVLPWPKVSWFLAVFLPAIAVGIPAGAANQSPGTLRAIVENPDVVMTPKDEKVAAVAVEKAAAQAPPNP